MRNVTITITEELARWARVWAAEHDTSLSAMISQTLKEMMDNEARYQVSMKGFLAKEPDAISGGKPYPNRADLHER